MRNIKNQNRGRASADERQYNRRDWLFIGLVCGFWMLFGTLIACQWYWGMRATGRVVAWWRIAGYHWLAWNVWSVLTPVVLLLGRRFPLTRARWRRDVALHCAFGLTLAVMQVAAFSALYRTINPTPFWAPSFGLLMVGNLREYIPQDLLIYWAIIGVGAALHFYSRYRERESHAAQLEARLAQAQLEALRMQLNPHFLFNTLHSIAALVRSQENQAAVKMIAGLSELLRHSLENAGQQEVSLREELDFIEGYLEIQQQRFSDRLQIELKIAPETLSASVPNMILQPLVENAIRHGVARRHGGRVEISAARTDGQLQIEVYNDGARLPAEWRLGEADGIGLSNTQARLQQVYGDVYQFEVGNAESGGVLAKLLIPWRPFAGQEIEDE